MTQTIGKKDLRSKSFDDEQREAYEFVVELISKFLESNGYLPTKIYASDHDELQSLIMFAARVNGCIPLRTNKKVTYAE